MPGIDFRPEVGGFGADLLATLIDDFAAAPGSAGGCLRHIRELPARAAVPVDWPRWASELVTKHFSTHGVERPWSHQVEAADLAFADQHVVVATNTASGKSLAYQLPIVQALHDDPLATAMYLAPTKALAADQLRAARALTDHAELRTIAPADFDGDTSSVARDWARKHSRWLVTNPDIVHGSLLRNHARWGRVLRNLRFVVIDEAHAYRGVFGANVALIVRRLDRLAQRYGASPTFILSSATSFDPGHHASMLTGHKCVEVTVDGSPQGARTIALWEPPVQEGARGENGAPVRRPAPTEAAHMLASLVAAGARTLVFVRSRRGAELTALATQRQLEARGQSALAQTVSAYRSGYLAEDRRGIERALDEGTLRGVAATNALELGIDIAGLDAVVLAGYPGTRASFWQQCGRAGRRSQGALAVMVARDEPLDAYLVNNPSALLDRPVEATVFDPTNPYVSAMHMVCAASEQPLAISDVEHFQAREVVDDLVEQSLLRRRGDIWYPAVDIDPYQQVDVRGSGGHQVTILESGTARVIGLVDGSRADSTVHPGAVYLHQGESFVVDDLDLEAGLAFVRRESPSWTTFARSVTDISLESIVRQRKFASTSVALCNVRMTQRVIGYMRKSLSGEVMDFTELDLPEHHLSTKASMWVFDPVGLERTGIDARRLPGSLHAAEHAAIGLLPLVATCDRADIGGLSTAAHPDTGLPTVFVYDGHPGGAGFAERGDAAAADWFRATRDAIRLCPCDIGCPSCVQSPKCGNFNSPLDKHGANTLLDLLITDLTDG